MEEDNAQGSDVTTAEALLATIPRGTPGVRCAFAGRLDCSSENGQVLDRVVPVGI